MALCSPLKNTYTHALSHTRPGLSLAHMCRELLYKRASRLVVQEAEAGGQLDVRYAADVEAGRDHLYEELSLQQVSRSVGLCCPFVSGLELGASGQGCLMTEWPHVFRVFHPFDPSAGLLAHALLVSQVSWLEASLMGLTMMQLDLFSHDVDPEALCQVSKRSRREGSIAEADSSLWDPCSDSAWIRSSLCFSWFSRAQAREVVGSVAPGSDLHLSLAAREMMAAMALVQASRKSREKAESIETFQVGGSMGRGLSVPGQGFRSASLATGCPNFLSHHRSHPPAAPPRALS